MSTLFFHCFLAWMDNGLSSKKVVVAPGTGRKMSPWSVTKLRDHRVAFRTTCPIRFRNVQSDYNKSHTQVKCTIITVSFQIQNQIIYCISVKNYSLNFLANSILLSVIIADDTLSSADNKRIADNKVVFSKPSRPMRFHFLAKLASQILRRSVDEDWWWLYYSISHHRSLLKQVKLFNTCFQ